MWIIIIRETRWRKGGSSSVLIDQFTNSMCTVGWIKPWLYCFTLEKKLCYFYILWSVRKGEEIHIFSFLSIYQHEWYSTKYIVKSCSFILNHDKNNVQVALFLYFVAKNSAYSERRIFFQASFCRRLTACADLLVISDKTYAHFNTRTKYSKYEYSARKKHKNALIYHINRKWSIFSLYYFVIAH